MILITFYDHDTRRYITILIRCLPWTSYRYQLLDAKMHFLNVVLRKMND